jgi:hypothetical protein
MRAESWNWQKRLRMGRYRYPTLVDWITDSIQLYWLGSMAKSIWWL